jgi:hypothetical protein
MLYLLLARRIFVRHTHLVRGGSLMLEASDRELGFCDVGRKAAG